MMRALSAVFDCPQPRYPQQMANTLPARNTGSRPRKKKKAPARAWYEWWPVALGAAVTPFAIRAAGVLALQGGNGMRLLYPYVLLLQERALGLPADAAAELAQGMMYLQFPLYGLFMVLAMRGKSILGGLFMAVLLHIVGIIFVFAMAQFSAT